MLWQLEEFQGPQFLGFVRNLPDPPSHERQRWLPNQTVFDLAFEYILGAQQKPVMAAVMGWDSEAPIHGRFPLGERVSGELPPIKRKAKISEKEVIRFLTPRAGTPDVQIAINAVYDLTKQLVDGIDARLEWLGLQALSEDVITYDEGGVEFTFDYGITSAFQVTAGTTSGYGAIWSTVATATPLNDLMLLANTVQQSKGFRPAETVLSAKAIGYLLSAVTTRDLIRGTSAPAAPITQDELDVALRLYQIPTLHEYDVSVNQEQDDGTLTEVRCLREDRAFMVPGPSVQLGSTLFGPTAESRVLFGTPLADQAPGVFAETYETTEPPAQWTKAVAVAFPSLPGADHLAQAELW